MNSLLPSDLLRQLEQLQLLSRRRSSSGLRGERRSRSRGHSTEFADNRSYSVGDDFRHLDWNLYARLDRLFVRLYEEERELPLTIFLDNTESMGFGVPTKFDAARRIAGALGYVALCGFDRVSVRPLCPVRTDPGRTDGAPAHGAIRSVRGRKSALPFLERLETLKAAGTIPLSQALQHEARDVRHPGIAVVLSDFLAPEGYEEGLDALCARGFQTHAIAILSPEELEPATYGDLRLVDAETGGVEEVSFGRHRLEGYRRTVERYFQGWSEFCRLRGIHAIRVGSDLDLRDFLLKQLRRLAVWG